jgi:flagellar secretion chaperone FliS
MNWKNAYLESRILSASPLDLVNILYEHAIIEIQQARQSLARGDVAARSRSILKAIAIIGELQSSLDHEAGGEIAANLGQLYQYMRARLTAGNLRQSDAPFAEVTRLLESLGDAWRAIAKGSGGNGVSGAWVNSPAGHITVGEEAPCAMAGLSA